MCVVCHCSFVFLYCLKGHRSRLEHLFALCWCYWVEVGIIIGGEKERDGENAKWDKTKLRALRATHKTKKKRRRSGILNGITIPYNRNNNNMLAKRSLDAYKLNQKKLFWPAVGHVRTLYGTRTFCIHDSEQEHYIWYYTQQLLHII